MSETENQKRYASRLKTAEIFSLLQDVLVHKDVLLTSTSGAEVTKRKEQIWRNIANKLSLIFNKRRTTTEIKKKWNELRFIGSQVLHNQTADDIVNSRVEAPYMPLLVEIVKSAEMNSAENDDIFYGQVNMITGVAPNGPEVLSSENHGPINASQSLESSRAVYTAATQQLQTLPASTTTLPSNVNECDVTVLDLPRELTDLLDSDFQLGQTNVNATANYKSHSSTLNTPVAQAGSSQHTSVMAAQNLQTQSQAPMQTGAQLQNLGQGINHQTVPAAIPSRVAEQQGTSSQSLHTGYQQNQHPLQVNATVPSSQKPGQGTVSQRPHPASSKGLSSVRKQQLKKELEVIALKRKYLELKLKTMDNREEILKNCLEKDVKQEN